MSQQPLSPLDIDSFEIHAPDFDPKNDDPYSKNENREEEDSQAEYTLLMDPVPLSLSDRPSLPVRRWKILLPCKKSAP